MRKYTQNYGKDGNKIGRSEQKKDWLGNEHTQHYDNDGNRTGTSEDKEGCFITTACIHAKGLPDDCLKLKKLRKYRDQFLLRTPEGKKMLKDYYRLAPGIVDAIDREARATEVYEIIY